MTSDLRVAKAHAYGNDFLFVDERERLSRCAGDSFLAQNAVRTSHRRRG